MRRESVAVRQVETPERQPRSPIGAETGLPRLLNRRRKVKDERKRLNTGAAHTEIKLRYDEIKGGVIVGTIGIGIAIFLFVFMQGVILSGTVTQVRPDSSAGCGLRCVYIFSWEISEIN